MSKLGKIMSVAAIIGIVGFAATSFAGWGRGWGGGGNCWGRGGGSGQISSTAPGSQRNLSDQEIEQIAALVNATLSPYFGYNEQATEAPPGASGDSAQASG